MAEILKVTNLCKYFSMGKKRFVHAVNHVNFSVGRGETLGIVGESGSGKTTIGRCIVHLIKPTSGHITLMGQNVTNFPDRQFKKLRPQVQIVFQEPYDALNPRKRVKAILEDPLINEGKLNKIARQRRVKEILEMINLSSDYLNKYPIQLTQGEQQRIGIARAIATNPAVVVLDEPTSLLDIRFRAEIIALLGKLQRELGIAYIFISHDLVAVSQISHRIAVMYLGRIIEEGNTKTVLQNPLHPYTQALMGAVLFPDPDRRNDGLTLKGEVPSPINLPDNKCNLFARCPLSEERCRSALPSLEEADDAHFVACFRRPGRLIAK
ncbi:MAG: ATP-binding cassette domain-containing protein [bacterium]|nr:ATP-binding cassette domain-containing protein [bacterium]